MLKKLSRISGLLIVVLTFMCMSFNALAMEVPALTGPVVDQARLLDPGAKEAIASSIREFFDREGIQFQVLIVPELVNETIEGYSIKVVDKWKIGKTRDDRAALFLISIKDRKMRLEIGRGLEGSITDLTSKRIIDEVSALFKKEDYANGVALGLALMARADGKQMSFDSKTAPRHARKKSSPLSLVVIIFIFIFISKFGGGPLVAASILTGGRGGGFGGGGRGGGGWSGGGGGFSGGGASGDW